MKLDAKLLKLTKGALFGLASLLTTVSIHAEPLKIAYSDWPGWVAWEIGLKKGWFEEAGVDVEFEWYDYVASMDAYVAGSVDAVSMTNGDALVTGATGKPSTCIIINDYSNGNDMIVAAPGISTIKDLKGKKVGLEEGFVCHLLLLKGLKDAGMEASDVTIVNTPTNVEKNKEEWAKVVSVWYKIVDFMKNEDNLDEALAILSKRVNLKPEEYEPFLDGTYILSLDEALARWEEAEGLGSIYGSTKYVDAFNLEFEVYKEAQDSSKYLDPSFTKAYAASKK